MAEPMAQHNSTSEFLDESGSVEGKTILDVGCGDGFASTEFMRRGALRVVANDLFVKTPDPLDRSDIKYAFGPDRSSLGRFDIVWNHHVLEHQERPIDFLRDLRLSIKPEGQLWLTVPNMEQNSNLSPEHLMAYNMPLLIEHLRLAGFNVKDGSYWQQRGHLRVKVGIDDGQRSEYPEPMALELEKTGRCKHSTVRLWNWELTSRNLEFASFNNRYSGRECVVVGKGPTDFDFENLSKYSCPVFFINDAVSYEKYVSGESFFFAHDPGQLVWLPLIKSIAVMPVNGAGIKEKDLSEASQLVKYKWGGFDKANLDKSRDEIARSKQLYLNSGTMHALIHFIWFCGFKHIKFIGCDGLNNKKQLQSMSMNDGYDPRVRNLSKSKSWYCNVKIKRVQEWMCGRLKLTYEYIGTSKFGVHLGTLIPRIAHFIWFGQAPGWVNYNIDAFKDKNPDWEIKVHTNLDLLPKELSELADKSPRACQKSDILRYWVVHQYGGVYLDSDMYVVKSLNQLLGTDIFLIALGDGRIQNGVLGAVADSPVLGSVLDEIQGAENREIMGDRCVFGPTLWTRLRQSRKFTVLPSYYFEPFTTKASAIKFWKSTESDQHDQLNAIRHRFIDGVWPYGVHLKGSQFLSREAPI
jgi:SAM-dependent methyltransferase